MRVNSISVAKSDYSESKSQNYLNQRYSAKPSMMADTVSFGNVIKPSSFTHNISKRLEAVNTLISKKFESLNTVSIRRSFSDYELPVHNSSIATYMKETYTPNSFRKLFKKAESKGVFDFKVDEKTGFVKTSNFVPKNYEEEKMTNLVWVTDTCRNISLLKKERPELCTKALESLSEFYKHQQIEFDDVIANPEIFKNNSGWQKGGVCHAFYPDSNTPNYNYPRTRLESIGQYLQRSSELIYAGLEKNKNYGYKTAEQVGENTINAISSSVKYLKSINYPTAHSCGAWEEGTFWNSITSDTAILNEGMRRTLSLVFKKTENPEILKIQERILNSKHGDVFKNKEELANLLKAGEERLISTHDCEAPGERKLDAALSFVTHYKNGKLTHSENIIDDINENVKVLKMLEGDASSHGLVGEYGLKRYINDPYKNLNKDLPIEKRGNLNENHEAQWFMVSDIAKGYGVQLNKLIESINKEQRQPNQEEKDLIDLLLKKETEYINRSYARISGKNSIKANGDACPANKVSEAFQAITDKYNNVKYTPGTNTPLAWAQSSMLDASKVYMENIKALEDLNLGKQVLAQVA